MGNDLAQITDVVLADLIHFHRELSAAQGKTAFALFSVALCALVGATALFPSAALAMIMGVSVMSLALALSFCTDHMNWMRFRARARLVGLNDKTARKVFRAVTQSESFVAQLELIGATPSNEELIAFVR